MINPPSLFLFGFIDSFYFSGIFAGIEDLLSFLLAAVLLFHGRHYLLTFTV